MKLAEMDLQQYCALNRARFYIDPEEDAHWYFGNIEVQKALLNRIDSDLDVRGVPKCGVVGRFGIGKTHTLNRIKWLVSQDPQTYPVRPFNLDVVWDERNKELNSWRAIHVRMLDALGEPFLREIVRAFDGNSRSPDQDLAEAMQALFRFGDENLRRSLAVVLADNFKREARSTIPAWQWLKGGRGALESLGVPKSLDDAGDMVFAILNLGILARQGIGQGILYLMDEAQSLGNVGKAESEVHRALLKLADPDNRDVGFVLGVFGGGVERIPPVLTSPDDILSRLGVTKASVESAFIGLQMVLRSEVDIRTFTTQVLESLVEPTEAELLISEHGLGDVQPNHFPFTEGALDRLAKVLYGREETRNPRIVIDTMAKCCSLAYRTAKADGKYHLIDAAFAEPVLKDV